ncbi:uncharacterized protein LOC110977964 [Acanthaster planci]|uniref:Uncharacterized protein LOC110977964 n=1 Tax=Acanthaster planci TaxID=133434 RepID=A0A8B7Y4T6_ACAPL|nr:uncharacterized protein LOC110977964 [Acanthaster planci]
MPYQCLICPFRANAEVCFSEHLISKHKHDPGFIVKCGYCESTYDKYDSFRKHIYRKHQTDLTLERDVFVHEQGDQDSLPYYINELDDDENSSKCTSVGQCASYILQLQTSKNLSQTAIDDVVNNTRELISNINSVNCQKVMAHLESSGVNTGDIDLEGIFKADPFIGLETKAQQDKYFASKMGYIAPVEVEIGTKFVVKKMKNNKRAVFSENVNGYYVPFWKSLEGLLKHNEVAKEVVKGHSSNDGFMYDICDGSYVADHRLFQDNIQIVMYTDDIEIVNPIGSHVKKHKLSMFYWSLANIRPAYRSKLSAINLLAVAKTADLKNEAAAFHSDSPALRKLLEEFRLSLNKLAADGIQFYHNGKEYRKKGGLVCVLGDTPALHIIGGFKDGVSFAYKKCRTCECAGDEFTQHFTESKFTLRKEEEHRERCETLKTLSKEAQIYWSKHYGINSSSVLLRFPSFNVTECLMHDVMHTFFEGLVPREVSLLLRHCISEGYFTLDQFNATVKSFSFGIRWSKNKPCSITPQNLLPGHHLKQDSAQTWCLTLHLPLIIGHLVPLNNPNWMNFIRLVQIITLCTSHRVDASTAGALEQLIATHQLKYTQLYPDEPVTPKMHYCVHLPKQMQKFGPLRNLWAMRMEAKHSQAKSRKWRNFRNVPYSVSVHYQKWMCGKISSGDGGDLPYFVHEADKVKDGIDEVIDGHHQLHSVLMAAHPELDVDVPVVVMSTQEVTINAITYRVGDVLYYQREKDIKHFGKIAHIFVENMQKYFQLKKLSIVTFNSHLNSYEVKFTHDDVYVYPIPEKLWYPWPIIFCKNSTKLFVSLESDIDLEQL